MKKLFSAVIVLALVGAISCKKEKDASGSGKALTQYLDTTDISANYLSSGGVLVSDQFNRKVFLGRALFYDKQLSLNNSVACASCHKQENAFSDNRRFSVGIEGKLTGRNSMAIQNIGNINLVKNTIAPSEGLFFWDGRERDLEDLVRRPVMNHVEMGIGDFNELPAKLNNLGYYAPIVQSIYGTTELTTDMISESVALFMSIIISDNSRFDARKKGTAEFTAIEEHGEQLFLTKYNCGQCHQIVQGAYNGVQGTANIGLDAITRDKGMGAVKGDPAKDGVFKAPNLRNVAVTAPYMHDGRFNTLEDVIEHYSEGIQDNPNTDWRLRDDKGNVMKMNISEHEKTALVAFLKTLTDHNLLTNSLLSNPFKTR